MNQKIIQLMEEREDLRKYLFARGFLLTDHPGIRTEGFPFYGAWREVDVNGVYRLYAHEQTKVTLHTHENRCFLLIGHAYDPCHMLHEEADMLAYAAGVYGTESYQDTVDGWTGVFLFAVLEGAKLEFILDASGLQCACHGKLDGHFMLCSNAQLLGDLFGLSMSPLVKRLVQYKWYYRMKGTYLPGDMTPFSEVLRVIPNTAYRYDGSDLTHTRIFPIRPDQVTATEEEYQAVIRESTELLHNSMELIARKWARPYISLTGGVDSNTAFAAANGLYDRFKTFTYVSAPKEEIDAEASQRISAHFGVPHWRIDIPDTNEGLQDYEELILIMEHNNGHVTKRFGNEYRKRVFLMHCMGDVDVEVKSWASEAVRAFYYNHYNRKRLPRCTPKVYRNLYKLFFLNRSLAHAIDRHFKYYMKAYEYDRVPASQMYNMYHTEVSMGSWGSLNLAEMRLYCEITSIYNNRKYYSLMYRTPLEKQIQSIHHMDMKKTLNPELYDLHIRVVNLHKTKFRANMLNLVFTLNNWLPF